MIDAAKRVPHDWVPFAFNKNGTHRADCNTIFFYNAGTQTVTIDSVLPLLPGQGTSFPCSFAEDWNKHTYSIVFANENAGGCNLVIYHKVY